jgi:Domain of unknown function (DUF4267)
MPQPNAHLARSSPLFWITLLLAAGLAMVGAAFLIVPRYAARYFGVPPGGEASLAFASAAGARDIFTGLILLPFLVSGQRRAVAWIVLFAALIPICDGTIVLKFSGVKPLFLAMHWGSALFLILLAALLFRDPGSESLR